MPIGSCFSLLIDRLLHNGLLFISLKNAKVGELLKEQESSGRTIGAICAAPMALAAHKIGRGKNVTIYPSMEGKMVRFFGDYGYRSRLPTFWLHSDQILDLVHGIRFPLTQFFGSTGRIHLPRESRCGRRKAHHVSGSWNSF